VPQPLNHLRHSQGPLDSGVKAIQALKTVFLELGLVGSVSQICGMEAASIAKCSKASSKVKDEYESGLFQSCQELAILSSIAEACNMIS
jgi:hypothetical protein